MTSTSLRSVLPGLAQTALDANDLADIVDLERYLTQHTDERGPLHVGLDRWISIETEAGLRRIAGFNHRDYLAALARRLKPAFDLDLLGFALLIAGYWAGFARHHRRRLPDCFR